MLAYTFTFRFVPPPLSATICAKRGLHRANDPFVIRPAGVEYRSHSATFDDARREFGRVR